MRRAAYSVAAALLVGLLSFLIGAVVSQYQVRVLLYSPDQAAPFVDGFLVLWPLMFFLGGWLGYRRSAPKA